MMNISNLIIAGITFIIFVWAAIYLYNNPNRNVNNTNGVIEKFQGTNTQNPITIADMATSIMVDNKSIIYYMYNFTGRNTFNAIQNNINFLAESNYNIIPFKTEKMDDTGNIKRNNGQVLLEPGTYRIAITVNKYVQDPTVITNFNLELYDVTTTKKLLNKIGMHIPDTVQPVYLTLNTIIYAQTLTKLEPILFLEAGKIGLMTDTNKIDTWASILVEKI